MVLAYDNPYSSNFRCNYMRAAVELVLLERNRSTSMEVDQRMLQWRYTGPHIKLEASEARHVHSHDKDVSCLSWQPGKEVLASGSQDRSQNVWREGDGGVCQQINHGNNFQHVTFKQMIFVLKRTLNIFSQSHPTSYNLAKS